MIVHRLGIEAIGPFALTQDIDFGTANRFGLFLIHGPTGSGKTTILDAICFALFGASSGDERKPFELRSHHVSDDTSSLVSLEFSVGGCRYLIKRSLSSRRLVNQQEKAMLECLEPERRVLADKRAEVANQVTGLLRLNAEQFRQVIVLPQGRFRDFLVAGSQDRERILENLFDTLRLADFSERLGGKRQAAAERHQVLQAEAMLLERQLGIDAAQAPEALLETLGQGLAEAEAARDRGREAWKLAQARLAEARLESQRHAERREAREAWAILEAGAERRAQDAESLEMARKLALALPAYEALQTARKRLAQDQELLGSLQARQHALADGSARAEAAALAGIAEREKLLEDEKALADLQRLEQAMAQALEARERHRKARESQARSQQELQQATQTVEKWQAQLLKIRGERQGLEASIASLPALDGLLRAAEAWEQAAASAEALEGRLAAGRAELQRVELRWGGLAKELAHARLEEAERQAARDAADAQRLAAGLRLGQACPVCGSTEHPHPATGQATDSGAGPAGADAGLPSQIEQLIAREAALGSQCAVLEEQLRQLQDEAGRAHQAGQESARAFREGLDAERGLLAPGMARSLDQAIEAQGRPGTGPLSAPLREALRQGQAALRSASQLDRQQESLAKSLAETEAGRESLRLADGAAREAAATQAATLEAIEARLRELWNRPGLELPSPGMLASLIAETQARMDRVRRRLDEEAEALRRSRADEAALGGRIAELERSLGQGAAQSAELAAAWEANLQGLGFTDEATALGHRLPAARIEELRIGLERQERERQRLQDSLSRLDAALQDRLPPDLDALEAALAEAETAASAAEDARAAFSEKLKTAQAQQERLTALAGELAASQGRLDELTVFHRLASGQEAAGEYVSLQRYALSVYLDEILLAANQDLAEMSRKRFQLVRQDQRSGKKRTGGLELQVLDQLTGLLRSTETLSGGESFLTALSLALGLSSVVHARSGGVRLDTLFVDEGFGSLDEDALEDAMAVLGRIHEQGRVIGIISHVRELRERINCRLVVEKHPRGSQARWAD